MNISHHPSGLLRRSRVLIILCAVVSLYSCSSAIKVKYVNWDVEFTKGTSEQDKAVAMDSIRRYILHSLSEQDYTGYILKQIIFNIPDFNDRDRTSVGVTISLTNSAGDAIAPPKVGGGPHYPLQPPGSSIFHGVNITARSE